jgi:hypothetical protein
VLRNEQIPNRRNAAIIQLHQSGTRQSDIASRFKISRYLVRELIKKSEREKTRRTELEKKYGRQPDIAALPDNTPIEVLLLCNAKISGWAVRIGHLEQPYHPSDRPPIRTLGDLRHMTDAQLLDEPNLGRKMLSELRRFCSPKTDETLECLFAEIRALSPDRKSLAIDALRKLLQND